ncbi:MAG TPA: hypothetical protein VGZ23_07070 [bacterium]|nr:hypothetical protein [bacterium]
MDGRTARTLALGIAIGTVGTVLALGAGAMTWTRHHGGVQSRIEIVVRPAQGAPINPREFFPLPNQPGNNPAQAPFPGSGAQQNCDRILFFYQGRLYQLRPGPAPRNGGNPEFFFMQPYDGPQIPGFPQMGPGSGPDPNQLPILKF